MVTRPRLRMLIITVVAAAAVLTILSPRLHFVYSPACTSPRFPQCWEPDWPGTVAMIAGWLIAGAWAWAMLEIAQRAKTK